MLKRILSASLFGFIINSSFGQVNSYILALILSEPMYL